MKHHNTIFVLGNPLEDTDRVPIQLLPELTKVYPNINFVLFDPTEELPEPIPKHMYLLDTIEGIDKVTLFTDMNNFLLSPRFSVHDFDVPLFLGILKKLGKINQVTIIGIPKKATIHDALQQITQQFSSMTF
jgi:hypothetical protein